MLIIHEFLKETESPEKPEEPLNFLIFIAQLPSDSINDVESASKLMFFVLSHVYKNNFCSNYLAQLENIRQNGSITLKSGPKSYKICIHDKSFFETVYLTLLKYMRIKIDNNEDSVFFRAVFKYVVKSNELLRSHFLHVLRMVEIILNKRDDILTPELSGLFLKFLNRIACSPLTGFKHYSHSISRIILKNLSSAQRTELSNFDNLPIKGIDLSDLLKLFKNNEIQANAQEINLRVIQSFYNNTDSRVGSFYYDRLLSVYVFEEFVENVWPSFANFLKDCESEGEFYQSILKYWIPVSVKHYKSNFYEFIQTQEVDFVLKAYTLLELKKRGHYDKSKFDVDALKFVKYSGTSDIAFKIFSTFLKKNIYPDSFELNAIKFYLKYHARSELQGDVLKSLKSAFSHIFLISHMIINKNIRSENPIVLYEEFFTVICNFCANRIKGQNCEMSAQILKIIWNSATGSTSQLVTNYKIDREDVYKPGQNLFYKRLTDSGIWQNNILNKNILNEIENVFTQNFLICSTLLDVTLTRYLPYLKTTDLDNLVALLKKINKSVCLQNSEIMRIYANFTISLGKTLNLSYEKDLEDLIALFRRKLGTLETEDLYLCVLILDILITYKKQNEELNLIEITEASLNYFGEIFEENIELDVKTTKVLEALINNAIECLIISKNSWQKFNKKQVLNQLCKIIQKSNMKKPVLISINVVQQFGILMEENEEDKEMKLKLLDNTLCSLYKAPSKLNVKIRRNPEFRLVIHALILSDYNPRQLYLQWSVDFMLGVLSDKNSSDSTLSTTLHSLEVLVSDNSIHQFTLKFIPDILRHCVALFNTTSWIVRNADLQLLKALIERFLGISLHSEIGLRPKTIEDFFLLFPSVVFTFYETLSLPALTDSAVIALLFFSESQIKNNIFLNRALQKVVNNFRYLFIELIQKYQYHFGALAVKSFTSLCLERNIPKVVREIVNFICKNFGNIKKNIFGNLISLLRELLYKYNLTSNKSDKEIDSAMHDLRSYLRQFACFYFNLLSMKIETLDEAVYKITLLVSSPTNYETRIWLNNYIPFVMNNLSEEDVEVFLNRTLFLNIPDFLQISILSILVDRLQSINLNRIVRVLVEKLVELEGSNKLLTNAYSKTILLFSENSAKITFTDDVLIKMRSDYVTTNIHKIFIYVLSVAAIKNKTKQDFVFLNESLSKYKLIIGDDNDEILRDLSATISPLFESSPILHRYDIIKLVFYLLLVDSTSIQMCRFVSHITKLQCSSVLIALEQLLDYRNLKQILQNENLSKKLLLDLFCYVNKSETFTESQTYYLIESDFSVPTESVKSIIRRSLFSVN